MTKCITVIQYWGEQQKRKNESDNMEHLYKIYRFNLYGIYLYI